MPSSKFCLNVSTQQVPRESFWSFPHTYFFFIVPSMCSRDWGVILHSSLYIITPPSYPFHHQIPLIFTLWMSSKSTHCLCVSLHHPRASYHRLWLYTWATTFTTNPSPYHFLHVTSKLSQVGFPGKPTWDGDRNVSSWLSSVSGGKEGKRSKLGQRENLSCSDVSTNTSANTVRISEDVMIFSKEGVVDWVFIPLFWSGYEP